MMQIANIAPPTPIVIPTPVIVTSEQDLRMLPSST